MKKDDYRRPVEESFPEKLVIGDVEFVKERSLRYGWNPGSPAAFYREVGAQGPCLGNMRIVQENPDKTLGYINLEDAACLRLVQKLKSVYGKESVAAVMKHVNPSGVAKAATLTEAFTRAWNCNALSAFGGVVCLSEVVNAEAAELIVPYFTEVVIAPGYSNDARELFAKKKDLRLIEVGALEQAVVDSPIEYKKVPGGLLVQERYESKVTSIEKLSCVTERKPSVSELNAALFNWLVCGYVRSNAIVIGDENQTIGIGTGQQSRIDSFRFAVWYANERSKMGCQAKTAASDAFFPEPDCIELAAKEGISCIVFTTGSKNDKQVIECANKYGITLLDSGERCFTH